MYTTILFIRLLNVLCSVVVRIHLFKIFIKPNSIAGYPCKVQDGLDSREIDAQQHIAHSSNPTFLDTVSDSRPHSDEIINLKLTSEFDLSIINNYYIGWMF